MNTRPSVNSLCAYQHNLNLNGSDHANSVISCKCQYSQILHKEIKLTVVITHELETRTVLLIAFVVVNYAPNVHPCHHCMACSSGYIKKAGKGQLVSGDSTSNLGFCWLG